MINPDHYKGHGGLECHQVQRAMVGSAGMAHYWRATAVKYVFRCFRKGGAADIRKAIRCLQFLLAEVEGATDGPTPPRPTFDDVDRCHSVGGQEQSRQPKLISFHPCLLSIPSRWNGHPIPQFRNSSCPGMNPGRSSGHFIASATARATASAHRSLAVLKYSVAQAFPKSRATQ